MDIWILRLEQLLVPFVVGQLRQRWIGGFVARQKKVLWLRRPRIDSAGGVRGFQRGCGSWDLAPTHRPLPRGAVHHQRGAPGNCDRLDHDRRTSTAVRHRGPNRDRLLWLEEITSQPIAVSQRAAARGHGRADDRAVNDVPPNAIDSVRVARPTIWGAPRPGHVATDFTGEQPSANRPRDQCPWSCC